MPDYEKEVYDYLTRVSIEVQSPLKLFAKHTDCGMCQACAHTHLKSLKQELDALIMLHH